MCGYVNFAQFYDSLMTNVEYQKRAEYVLSIFNKYAKKPSLLLDIGCGTGGFIEQFSKSGIDCVGIDPSEDMLMIAREKCSESLFLQQSAQELDLYGTVDGVVSLMDSLNHITNYSEFNKAISKISLFMEDGSLFIFDVNTEYKHSNILADNAYIYECDDVFCVWQNYTNDNLLTDISLDFFAKIQDETYKRFSDDFCEKAYSQVEIVDAITEAGLELVNVFDDLTFDSPKPDSERLFYVTRKVK